MDPQIKQKPSDLRRKLLKKAVEIISKQGTKSLTLRSLSTQVGVSRTAPYRHFNSKSELLLAIAQEGFKALKTQYQQINNNTSIDSFSRLQNIGDAYIEFAIRNPGIFRLMFGREITQQNRSRELAQVAKNTFSEYLIAVNAFQNEKYIQFKDDAILANYSWAAVHGLAMLLIDGQIQTSGERKGLPTLLSDERLEVSDDIQSKIDFSKQTLLKFWSALLKGVDSEAEK